MASEPRHPQIRNAEFVCLPGRKDLLCGHTRQRTGGMVYLTKPSCMGVAWIYGAITTACFLKYSWNESPAQRPLAFMTLNGMLRRRYSSVDPILILCPCSGLRPAVRTASPTLSRNLDLVSVRRVFAALYANRWDTLGGWFIRRCWASAVVGSIHLQTGRSSLAFQNAHGMPDLENQFS